jgi:hypothetical protein
LHTPPPHVLNANRIGSAARVKPALELLDTVETPAE